MSLIPRTLALTLIGTLALCSPAFANGLLATNVGTDDAGKWRRCHDRLAAEGATAVTQTNVSAPAAGLVWADLSGSDAADWDVAIFEEASGRLVAGSAGPRSNELAEGFTTSRDLIVQACLVDGDPSSANLDVGYLDTRTEASGPIQLVRVSTPTTEDKTRLTQTGLDLTEHAGPGYVEAVLYGDSDAAKLAAGNFDWTVRIADLVALERQNIQANNRFAATNLRTGLPSGSTDYRRLADYEADMKQLALENPNLVKLITLPNQSLEGRDILGVEITENVNVDDGKPVFLQIGVHHAREWPSSEHAMEWAFEVVNGYNSGDPRMKPLAQAVRTIVVPVQNPDGFNLSRESAADLRVLNDVHPLGYTGALAADPQFAYKRRNCRMAPGETPEPGECGDRVNNRNRGVDPNRNYGGLWGGPGASISQTSDIYRGEAPFSEPETQNIRELVSGEQVTTLITNHTFSNLVLRPPGVRAQGPPPDEEVYRALGDSMAEQNGYTSQKGYQLYDTTGTTEDWTYSATGGLGFTFEIGPDEFHPPYADVVAEWEGTRGFEGRGNREAYYIAMESTANEARHSVIEGSAPADSVIRLSKSFMTSSHDPLFLNDSGSSTGDPILFEDSLETTMVVPTSGQFAFHANPSTRPAVEENTYAELAAEPSRTETFAMTEPTVAGGGSKDEPHVNEHTFTLAEDDARAGLVINLTAEAIPGEEEHGNYNDLDLYVYRVLDDGRRLPVGSGADADGYETAVVDSPTPGNYVAVVVNWAAPDPRYTGSWETYGPGEIVSRGATDEFWTLTCEKSDGTVVDTRKVFVERGQRVSVGAVCGSGGSTRPGKGNPGKPDGPPGKPPKG